LKKIDSKEGVGTGTFHDMGKHDGKAENAITVRVLSTFRIA
jgi:hypothetical protein